MNVHAKLERIPDAACFGLPEKHYTVKKFLGKGLEAEIYLTEEKFSIKSPVVLRWLIPNYTRRKLYAFKMIPRNCINKNSFVRAILIQTSLTSKLTNQIEGVILTSSHICIKLEYAPGGDLYHWVKKNYANTFSMNQLLSEKKARFIFRQLISIAEYLETNHVAHEISSLQIF